VGTNRAPATEGENSIFSFTLGPRPKRNRQTSRSQRRSERAVETFVPLRSNSLTSASMSLATNCGLSSFTALGYFQLPGTAAVAPASQRAICSGETRFGNRNAIAFAEATVASPLGSSSIR